MQKTIGISLMKCMKGVAVSESDLVKKLQCVASERGHRLFRNITAMGWAGQATKIHQTMMVQVWPGDVVVRKAYPIRAGLCEGSSDLIGLNSAGRFLAVEVKAPKGRMSDGQESFLEMVQRLGGIGIVAKSIADFNV
jgi:hypothetical protein